MDFDEYDLLNQLIDTTETLEVKLQQANLTFIQAKKNMTHFIAQLKDLCATYSLPLNNKSKFPQKLSQIMQNLSPQDLFLLYTAILYDKGLIFDIERTNRTSEQDIGCYLTLKKDLKKCFDEFSRKATYKSTFSKLKNQCSLTNIPLQKSGTEADIYFVFQTFTKYFAIARNNDSEIIMDNIALICSLMANNEELLHIAPIFIYQVISKHKARFCKTENFHFEWDKLWSYKSYQIAADNGKNFNNIIDLVNFFLDLCHYFSQNSAVDVELSHYIFSESTNLCEWYYSNYEYDEKVTLSVPLTIRITQSNIDCFENMPSYGCTDEEFTDFFSYKKSYTKQVKQTINQYLAAHPAMIEQYIDITPTNLDKKQHLVYKILDDLALPAKYIPTTDLPLLYSVITTLIEIEINQQTEKALFIIGNQLIDTLLDINIQIEA
ncbi:hypothetical protein SAMN05660742_11012 [Propionispira arboris]|uniref:Uncharacterized protein n=1 Tax=Propionispira arboris TaxID=84035 RepID=A0A1H6ZXP1_9FIRM|nr:hypothetical protein [Propionispira arboris]SEJ54360.1 hypothetical protein SAMN05660742_11012 [Propionispira arboris]